MPVKLPKLKCNHCGHEWCPRPKDDEEDVVSKPKKCHRCQRSPEQIEWVQT